MLGLDIGPFSSLLERPTHAVCLAHGLFQPQRHNVWKLRSASLQRCTAGLCKQGPIGISRQSRYCCSTPGSAASEGGSPGSRTLWAQGSQLRSPDSSNSDQTTFFFGDQTGQRFNGSSLNKLSINPGQVHMWWLFPEDVQDAGLLAEYERLLTAEEHSHMMAATTPQLRKERLLARVLVRTTLSRYCGGDVVPRSLTFSRNHAGKPHLLWDQHAGEADLHGLQFNLSHTASLLGCAVTAGRPVGLDVEESNRHTRVSPLRLARRRFSAAELATLEECTEGEERAQHFVRLWTLKEAYVKAVGRGIGAHPGLSAFSVLLQPRSLGVVSGLGTAEAAPQGADNAEPLRYDIAFASSGNEEDMWDFVLFSPSPQHTAALCVQRAPAQALSTMSSSSSAEDGTASSAERAADRMSSASSSHTGVQIPEKPEVQCNWSLQCWRTIPLVHDKPMEPDDLLVQGCSLRDADSRAS